MHNATKQTKKSANKKKLAKQTKVVIASLRLL